MQLVSRRDTGGGRGIEPLVRSHHHDGAAIIVLQLSSRGSSPAGTAGEILHSLQLRLGHGPRPCTRERPRPGRTEGALGKVVDGERYFGVQDTGARPRMNTMSEGGAKERNGANAASGHDQRGYNGSGSMLMRMGSIKQPAATPVLGRLRRMLRLEYTKSRSISTRLQDLVGYVFRDRCRMTGPSIPPSRRVTAVLDPAKGRLGRGGDKVIDGEVAGFNLLRTGAARSPLSG